MRPSPLDTATLFRIRWLGTVTLAGLFAGGLLGVLPASPLPTVIGVLVGGAAVNGLLHALGPRALGPVLVADTALITWLLASSGGATNPLTLLFLYPVILASMGTSLGWTVALGLLTTASFAALLVTAPDHVHHMNVRQHLLGMVVAYGVTVPLLAAAVHRFRQATALAEAETLRARESSDRAARLSSLAALAGGAAHEIANPLSTILLVARELQRTVDPRVASELEVIVEEVQQCTLVLDHLAMEVAAGRGEAPVATTIAALISEVGSSYDPVTLDIVDAPIAVPTQLIRNAIRRLLGNARQALDPSTPIVLRARLEADALRVDVQDTGAGMPPNVLAHACDPFFSTRHGDGMGLGLFFVQSVANQLAGTFELHSTLGQGTHAILRVPARPL